MSSSLTNMLDYQIFTFHELSDANGSLKISPPTISQPSSHVKLNRNDKQNFVIKI